MIRLAPLGVVALLLVSGCTMPLGSDSASSTETLTPAAVPEGQGVDQWQPSVESGDSLERLVDTHSSILNGSSYSVTARHTGPLANQPQRSPNLTSQSYFGANRSRYYIRQNWNENRWERWMNETVGFERTVSPNGTNVSTLPSTSGSRLPPGGTYFFYSLQYGVVTDVTDVDDGYVVTGEHDDSDSFLFADNVTVHDATYRLHVTNAGLIDRYEFRYTISTPDSSRATGVDRITVDLGIDSFPRPEWVADAMANRTTDS